MTRNGKLARLPQLIREQINRRLDDGEQGHHVVKWLNTLPEVKTLMEAEFNGQPVNENNLSNWKLGGYLDWQTQQEGLETTRQLRSEAAQLGKAAGRQFTDQLAVCLTARLAVALRQFNAVQDDPAAQLNLLRELCLRLAALRKGDHNLESLKLKRDRFDLELKKLEAKDAARKLEEKKLQPEGTITKEGWEQLEKELKLI